MTKKDLLIDELSQIPEPYIDTVLDFVRFLKTKTFDDKFGTLALSEASLSKDWRRSEEDKAWKDL